MKRVIGISLILVAALASAHTVHLADGSRLEGEVLLLNEQSLILSTSYAGTLTLERDKIAAIVFIDGYLAQARVQSNDTPLHPETTRPIVTGTGILELSLDGDPVKSSVRYLKESDREAMSELNTLHLRIFMDGREVAHVQDMEMDKEFRQGKWLVLRNSHRFKSLRLELPAGNHRLQVVVGNDTASLDYAGNQELLSSEVVIENVDILPGQKTRVVLKGKGGRLGTYGNFQMELLSSR